MVQYVTQLQFDLNRELWSIEPLAITTTKCAVLIIIIIIYMYYKNG